MKTILRLGIILSFAVCGVFAQGPSDQKPPEVVRVVPAKLVHRVSPIYPDEAKTAGIYGQVRLNVIIGKDGKVKNMTLLNGHPALAKAAMKAVSKWRYKPALLNGKPMEVPTEVTLDFALSGS